MTDQTEFQLESLSQPGKWVAVCTFDNIDDAVKVGEHLRRLDNERDLRIIDTSKKTTTHLFPTNKQEQQ